MVSDTELVERLRELLREADLSTTTTSALRRCLEGDFGIDLSQRKAFIREQVNIFISELNDQKEANENEDAEDAERNPEAEGDLKVEEQEGSGSLDNDDENEEEGEGQEDEDEEDKNDEKISRKRKSNKTSKEVKKRGGGFTKLCSLSPILQDFVGEAELARTEVVKRLWAYIREKNLQDPNNRKKIICDERLQPIFNVNCIDMFQMNKALSKHIWPLNSGDGLPSRTSSPTSASASSKSGSTTPVKPKQNNKKLKKENDGKKQKKGSSGLLIPLPLSDDLIQFFGTGEATLSRPDVVKRMWIYIKENNLQDPADKRNVICDQKLKELLKVDTFRGFAVSKLLTPHFIKEKHFQSFSAFDSAEAVVDLLTVTVETEIDTPLAAFQSFPLMQTSEAEVAINLPPK